MHAMAPQGEGIGAHEARIYDSLLAGLAGKLPGVRVAAVFVPSAHGNMLERVAALGPADVRIYDRFPLASRLPVADVFREGEPRYFERPDDWAAYPLSLRMQVEARGWPSVAVVPLLSGGRIVGVIYIGLEPGTALQANAGTIEAAARAALET